MVMTKSQIPESNLIVGRQVRWKKWTWFILVLALAAALRLYRLDSVPPGLTHDEANNVHDAASILHGVRPLYFPVAQGKEPLYPYSVALVMTLAGSSPLAMRLTSALWGLLLIVLSYVWAKRAFNYRVALWTAAGSETSPSMICTTQRPQLPFPPHRLTRSTPRWRAHPNSESPTRHSPLRPTGSKSM